MSTVNTTTVYQLSLSSPYGGGGVNFTTMDGWTDDFALQLQAALNTVTWPSGNSASVLKITTDQAQYVADTSVTPPVFD